MSYPVLIPKQNSSVIILPETGSAANVAPSLPYGVYGSSPEFVTGAVKQVAYTYRMLGGDTLDLEITEKSVYAAYESAVLKYSYLVNLHQAKNSLSDALGSTTGSFDHLGGLSGSLAGSNFSLKYPRFNFMYARDVADTLATEARAGGTTPIHSASVVLDDNSQDYDLDEAIRSMSEFSGSTEGKRIVIRKVFFKTPQAMWRFYGYYGGLATVGNLSQYGQFADDSTFEIIPPWQNKLQSMAFEDAIYTRNSQYSYQLRNNKLRIFPKPVRVTPVRVWFEFSILDGPYDAPVDENGNPLPGVGERISGVNNLNTLPYENLPYENINSMGKHWIRDYALALSMCTLGRIRSKLDRVPIPGESVGLDGRELLSECKDRIKELEDSLMDTLDELTYNKLAEQTKDRIENTIDALAGVPLPIYVDDFS